MGDFDRGVNTFYLDRYRAAQCISEYAKYRLKEGRFSNAFVQDMAKQELAWKWWMLNGSNCELLRP